MKKDSVTQSIKKTTDVTERKDQNTITKPKEDCAKMSDYKIMVCIAVYFFTINT